MLYDVVNGQTGLCIRVKVRQDNTGTKPGQGFTGLAYSTSGLIVSTICDNEATATAYTAAGPTIQTIATLGTYAAPSASNCRLKEVDATNHPGLIEIQLLNARLAVSSAKEITITVTGVAGLADCDVKIPLRVINPYASSYGLSLAKTTNITGFNDITAGSVASLILATPTNLLVTDGTGRVTIGSNADKTGYSLSQTFPTNFSALAITAAGVVTANTTQLAGQTVTAGAGVTFPGSVASPTNITAGTITTVSGNVNGSVSSVTGSVASVSGAVTVGTNTDKTGYALTSVEHINIIADVWTTAATRILTAGTNIVLAKGTGVTGLNDIAATAVWDQATSGHTTNGTFGAAMNAAGSAGDPWSTSLPGSYGAGTAGYAVGHNLDAQVSTRSTYAGGAVASVTEPVTAGTVTDKTGYALNGAAVLGSPRDLSAVADGSITVTDALWCAVAAAAGKETIASTTYTVKTPYTGTTIRQFTLDSATAPTSRT